MTFFFVGQRVRVINAPAAPDLVGMETTIVESGILGILRDFWRIDLINPETGEGWICMKKEAHWLLAPAIPPEAEEEDEEQEAPIRFRTLDWYQNLTRFVGCPDIPIP